MQYVEVRSSDLRSTAQDVAVATEIGLNLFRERAWAALSGEVADEG
jgi:hypothetical protein